MVDFGADATGTAERLAQFHRVENTYLSTFQALGGLGLILGTMGLATVLLRNVLERGASWRCWVRWDSEAARPDDGRRGKRVAARLWSAGGCGLCRAGDCAGDRRARRTPSA